MAAHTDINSKEDFDNALATPDKFVFIYAYEGEVSPQAEEYAKKFADKVASFKVDVSKMTNAKNAIGASQYPTAIVFKDGKELKKVEGMSGPGMAEIGQMLS